MLKHMHLDFHYQLVEDAVCSVIKSGKIRTPDMGGYSTTSEFTNAVIEALH
jgi:isocitrate dehydrogenase (NAD+)